MKRTKTKSADDQRTRFIEAAKKISADESGKTFEKVFKKVVNAEKPKKP